VADDRNIHWTNDEALLERYVMGRVSAEDSAALGEHLSGCPECREIVRAEQQIIAGIRRVGRDELKQRLAQRVGRSSAGTMSAWYRVAGIAAAIILLVTIGIYSDWFSGGRVQQSMSPALTDSSTPKHEQKLPGVMEGSKGPGQMPYADGRKEKKEAAQGAEEERIKGAEMEQRKALQIERGNPQNVDVAHAARPDNLPMNQTKDEKVLSVAAQGSPEIWVDGTDVSAASGDRTFGTSLMKKEENKTDNLISAKRAANPAAREARGIGDRRGMRTASVVQKKLAEVPPMQRKGGAGLVQMLLRKNMKGVQLTIFTDSLLSESDIAGAQLQMIRGDSSILYIGRKLIAFKLPEGWIERTPGPNPK
jgi:hypothetical protein